MKTLFLDESGELGFKLTSSNYFVITILSCENSDLKCLRAISKRVRTRKLKKKYKDLSELKGNNSSDAIRKVVLEKLGKLNIEIYILALNKKEVYDYLKKKKHKLYNYIASLILNECVITDDRVELIADNRGGQILAKEFSDYVKRKFGERNQRCKLSIVHLDSKKDGGLQMVDFISWAVFRKYEHKDDRFYRIIESKIKKEEALFSK